MDSGLQPVMSGTDSHATAFAYKKPRVVAS